jgi:hypothetical protein
MRSAPVIRAALNASRVSDFDRDVGSWRDAYQRWKEKAYPPPYKALPANLKNASEFERWRAQYHKWRVQQYGGNIPSSNLAQSTEDEHPTAECSSEHSMLEETPANWGQPFGSTSAEKHTGYSSADEEASSGRPFQASNIVPFNLQPSTYKTVDGLVPLHDGEDSIPSLQSSGEDHEDVSTLSPLQLPSSSQKH